MPDPADQPMSRSDIDSMKAEAAKGNFPTLETLKRYLASARASFLATPKKVESSRKARTAKPDPSTPDQIDFF